MNVNAHILFLISGIAAVTLLAACTFVHSGTVAVSGSCLDCTHALTDDAVALAIAPVLERHGLHPVWASKARHGPCTGERGCSWAHEGKGWLDPWVLVGSLTSGQVRIRVEARNDDPRADTRVRDLTEEVAKVTREYFGSDNVVVEGRY